MKILDRYIIRVFLLNFAILFVVLMLLFVVVDLIVDLDEFLSAGRDLAEQYGGQVPATLAVIGGYYGPLVTLLYVFFSGLLVVAAMGFTLSAMLRTRELVAIVASGLSLYRVAAPMIIVGIALNAAALLCQELVVPHFAARLARSKSQVDQQAIANFPVRYAVGETGTLISAAEFDASQDMLLELSILERNEQGLATRLITAEQAEWNAERGGWELVGGRAYQPTDDPLALSTTEPVDFFAAELSPTVLLARNATIYPRLLPMAELQRMQSNQAVDARQRNQITQIIWGRFSLLVMNVLVLVMGLPFFLQLGAANLLMQSLRAAAVCLGAWGGGLIMLQIGAVGLNLNPVAAAWLPVVLYLPVSAVLLQLVRT